MTPDPATESKAQSAQSSEIALLWRRYLACRDERSHNQLLRAVDRLIRLEAKRMLVSRSYLAEEAAQEALLGIERKIGSLEAPEYPVAFIRKVLSNKVATILQRESRRQAREEQNWSPDVPDENITTSTEWHEFLGTLRTAVNDDEFWTLVLHYHFDFSYDEIGELLEKEAGTIRQIALRGRRKCRQRLTRLEGRVPAWFGLPDPSDEQWRLIDPDDVPAQQQGDSSTGNGQVGNDGTNEYSTSSDTPDWPPEITARKAGQWGQDISDSTDGLRRASIGSDSSAPREPKTTSRRFGQLTVHVGTATSRLEGVGRRWLCKAPSSVLPLVALVAVPALAFFPDADASAVVQSTTSSEPTGPTVTVVRNREPVITGGGSAGADRAGRNDLVERPSDQSPTGPAQFPAESEPNDPDERETGPTTAATTSAGAAGETTTEPTLFFDRAIAPSGPALPVPTEPFADTTTLVPTTVAASASEQVTTLPAPPDTQPSAVSTTSALAPTTAAVTTIAPQTTAPSTTVATTLRTTTTQPRTTTTAAATTATSATTAAPTTTTIAATTITTTTASTTTAATTIATTTTAPTTSIAQTTTTTPTTAPTTTTIAPSTTSSVAPSTTTTTAATTTTQTEATSIPPPIGPT